MQHKKTQATPVRLAVAFVLLSLAGIASATECPGNDGRPLPATAAERSALAVRLANMANACQNDPAFLAWYGALLHALGRPGEAALLLERALMLNPDLAGARVDYAEALAALGDRSTARTLFDELLRRPDLPEHLGDPFRRRLIDLTPPIWQLAGSITARLGYETNLNSAPVRDTLGITLPTGMAEFTLDESFRARGGAAMFYELSAQAVRMLGALKPGARINLAGEFKARTAQAHRSTDFTQADILAQVGYPAWGGEWLADGALNVFHYDATRLYQSMRIGLAYQLPVAACQWRVGSETEARHYPINPLLDGQFKAITGGTRCALVDHAVSMTLRRGYDQAQSNERPGGAQWRTDLRTTLARSLAKGVIQAELQLGRQSDATSYSPLLADGAPRRIDRAALRIEYAYPLARHWDTLISIETSRQRSNIALFDIDNNAAWIGFRWNGQ